MKKPFQVGERVRVFSASSRGNERQLDGIITKIPDIGCYAIEVKVRMGGDYEVIQASRKQCRRLVKKPKRRLWIRPLTDLLNSEDVSLFPKEGWEEWKPVW